MEKASHESILVKAIRGADVVLLSDYNKGILTNETTQMIISICRQLVILLPGAWLIARLTNNVYAVWWCFPIAEIVALVLCLFFYHKC